MFDTCDVSQSVVLWEECCFEGDRDGEVGRQP